VLAEVSAKLLDQFVDCLHEKVLMDVDAQPAASKSAVDSAGSDIESPETGPVGPQVRVVDSAPAEPVDLVAAAGGSVAKRVVPALLALAVLVVLLVGWRRRRR
jgi:hypothetical protein